MEINWSKEALNDLDVIHEYMATENLDIAFDIIFHIIEKVETLLPQFTHLGHAGRVFGTRELTMSKYPYVIIYTVKNKSLYVIRVLHSSVEYPI